MDEHARLERLTFFSDAVFAIAMTLLVVEVRAPHLDPGTNRALAQALVDLIPNYIGFVVSFVVIARFWIGHHRVMALLARADARLVRWNLALLMAIAFLPFPTAVLSNNASVKLAVAFYAGYLVLVGVANVGVIRAALADRRLLSASAPTNDEAAIRRSMWQPLVIGALALGAAIVHPLAGLAVLIVASPLVAWALTGRGPAVSKAPE